MSKLKEIRKKYLNDELKLEKWQKVAVFCSIYVVSGIIGWIYEFIFYFFNGGMKEFYLQGGNFLPWINIYAFGAFLILFLVKILKIKKKPLLVFLVSMVGTGVLEYIAGWLVFNLGNGARFWNYNTEILNFGNIDGFVCLRSVLAFGLSALGLVYLLMPAILLFAQKMSKKVFYLVVAIFAIFLIDEVYNSILTRVIPGLPYAVSIYQEMGGKYVPGGT